MSPTWTVSRPIRAVWLFGAASVRLSPGDRLVQLHQSGPNLVCLYLSEWIVIPPVAWPALEIVPPPERRVRG